jgi:hypothetical protein
MNASMELSNLQFRFGFEEKRLNVLDEAIVTDDARITYLPDFVQLFLIVK